jgi:hypothetical protein
MTASADFVRTEPAPLRLLLGSDAYHRTRQILAGRLAALEAQKALAATTDVSQLPAKRSVIDQMRSGYNTLQQ